MYMRMSIYLLFIDMFAVINSVSNEQISEINQVVGICQAAQDGKHRLVFITKASHASMVLLIMACNFSLQLIFHA